MRHGPFGPEELGLDSKFLHIMMRDLDHILEIDPGSDSHLPSAEGGGENPPTVTAALLPLAKYQYC